MSKEQQGGGIVKAWEATIKRSQAAAKKRTASIFGTLTVSPRPESDPDVTPGPRELYIAEKLIVNGDYYTGHWVDNLPNGHGKYLWLDGCMYEGEWFRGKTMGKGKFSWPSGATYEGEFKSGFMDGKGTYIGSTGDTYRGSWVMNLKHGHGTKIYSNGDYFDGDWSRGMQDGQGRYQWKNGNKYIGQWRNGNIHGNGTLIWSNGNRYDGFWEDGVPKGNGTFRWADGSFYVGVWSKDGKDQSGTYYPPPGCASSSNNFEWDPQELYDVDLSECEVVPDEMVSVFPSQKLQDCGGFEGEYLQKPVIMRSMRGNHDGHRRSSVDGSVNGSANGNHSPYSYTSGHHSWTSDSEAGCETFDGYPRDGDETMGSPYRLFDDQDWRGTPLHPSQTQPVKRQGDTISKGHKNYELMLNLQLGIRHSVGRAPPPNSLELKMSAFDPKEKVWTKFPPEGSKHTPPHQSSEFRWKDYCPLVFRTLRKLFKVDPADYMLSICGDDALRELSSPGKSGSFFYLTNDDKYMIKTIKKAEVKVLLRMLPAYYNHVRSFENTLVTRFFGLHCVKLTGSAQKKVRFVIMGNLFCTAYTIHRRFDLKGSSLGRMTDKPESEIDPTTTLKDLDLNYLFRLQKTWFQEFLRQVDRDCDLLEQERIMDYSLLVGVHFVDCSFNHATEARISGVRTPTGIGTPKNGLLTPRLSREDADQLIDPTKLPVDVRLGISMAARVERTERKYEGGEPQLVGEPTGEFRDVILFFGIIDILQDYDISKKLEHVYKSMQYDPTSISAVEPRHYSKRFRDFIFKVFAEDEEHV